MATPAPLQEWVAGIRRALLFLRDATPERSGRVQLPVAAWREALASRGESGRHVGALEDAFSRLEQARGAARQEAAEACLAALAAFERSGAGTAAPNAAESSRKTPRGGKAAGSRSGTKKAAAASAPGGPKEAPRRPSSAAAVESIADAGVLAGATGAIRGVGPKREKELAKYGLETLEDVLWHLPFRYEDRRRLGTTRDLCAGETQTLVVQVRRCDEKSVGRSRRRILSVLANDADGGIELIWYHQVRWFSSRMKEGSRWLVHGRVEAGYGSFLRMVHPEVEALAEEEEAPAAGLVPVYEKPTAMPPQTMRRIVEAAVTEFASAIPVLLPESLRREHGLLALPDAMAAVHQPDADADSEALAEMRSEGHRSIVFEELFLVQLGLLLRKASSEEAPGISFSNSATLAARMIEGLPFALTGAQQRVIEEISSDMGRPHPMHRLVQGDVGSGKTVVAVAAALRAIEAGHQAVLMAPTELLAEQHWKTVQRVAGGLGVRLAYLSGEVGAAERRELLPALADGEPALVVGTHALIQEEVRFGCLGLAIIDEQHRFGVMQRAILGRDGDAGAAPDVLLMTATPIPRTMALSVYGDLDLSTIDELPPGRKPILTEVLPASRRERAWGRIEAEVAQGRQAYVVFPLIEESENSDLRDATQGAEELAARFPQLRIALIHGRVAARDREVLMREFQAGQWDVLVATTVIEVGIDVPNATLMVIEHAERFGLSQLHQLRGRVGRGDAAASCLLLAEYAQSKEARERLRVMTETGDGLKIAEADLAIRGPGAMLGTRQSGLPDFRVANLLRDQDLLHEARRAAAGLLADDPGLEAAEHKALREGLERLWAGRLGLARVG